MTKKMILAAALLVCTALASAQAGQGGQGGGQGQGRGNRGGGFGFGQGRGGFGGGQNEMQLAFRKDVQTDLAINADQKTKLDELQAKQRQGRGNGANGGNRGNRGNGGAGGNGGNGGSGVGSNGNGGNGGSIGGGNGGAGGGGGQGRGNFDPEEMRKRMEEQRAQQHKDLSAILNEGQMKRLGEIRVQLQGNRALLQEDTQKSLGLSADQVTKIKDLQQKQQQANQSLMEKVRSGEIQREEVQKSFENNNKILDGELAKVLNADQTAKFKAMSGKPFKADPPQARGGGNGGGK